MKIRPVSAQMFHADGQTYVTKLIAAFRNIRNALQKALIGTLSTKTRTPNLGRGGGGHPILVTTWWGKNYLNEGRLEPETLHLVPRNMERLHCAIGAETRLTWRHTDDTLSAWPADPHFLFLHLATFLCWRILNTSSPRIITLTAFHKTEPKKTLLFHHSAICFVWVSERLYRTGRTDGVRNGDRQKQCWKLDKFKYSDTSANEDNSFRNHIR